MQAAPTLAPVAHRPRFTSHWIPVAAVRFAAGVGAGHCLVIALWSFWSQWGSAGPASTGLTLAVIATLAVGFRASLWRHTFQSGTAPLWCGLAVAVASAPVIAAGSLDALRWIPATALEQSSVSTILATIAALACVGPTIVCLCTLMAGRRVELRRARGVTDPLVWFGIAFGLLVAPQSIALWLGLQQLGWLLSCAALVAAMIAWRRVQLQDPQDHASTLQAQREQRRHPWHLTDFGHMISAFVIGLSCALCLHINSQLQPGMTFVIFAAISGLVAGVAFGLAVRFVRGAGCSLPPGYVTGGGMLLSVVSAAVLAATFDVLTSLHLWLSATESRLWILMPARALLAALPMAPCGFALLIVADERPDMMRGNFRSDLSTVISAAGAGFLLFRWWGPEPAELLPWFELFGCGLSLVFLRIAGLETQMRRRATLAAGVGIALAAAGFWFSDYDPARSARVLYSSNVFEAYRKHVDADSLAVLDDGRLAAVRSNGRSTWTVWKHHGAQLQFRENGVPRHIVSTNLAICPQSSAELLPAVASLVIHPQPRHVLLTGLGSTATLQSCLAFPVASVTCSEPDAALVDLARSVVTPESGLDDPRVRIQALDAPLSAAAAGDSYDVIIVAATQPGVFNAVSTSTTDYYKRLAHKLQPGGVLCQRFQYVDFGADPLVNMAATLRAVFPQVRMLETAPGEMLLLACMDDGPVFDAGVAVRAEAPHVRRVMSQTGWDWSVLLGLAAVDAEATNKLIAARSRTNFAADGRAAFDLAPEVMRWGPKLDEIKRLLAEHSSQMMAWIGPCAETEAATKRLADVSEQRRIIYENPEQFWEYRKSLKERLQNRPRTQIVPVSHEGLRRKLHPEDERRKDYLVALGNAARQAEPDMQSIRRLAAFVDPYDPLISYFAHHEAANLLSRSAEPDQPVELAHRLHTVYFGAGVDRSVRNVTESLTLLVDQPDSASSPQARWDHLNSLLDVLCQRWALRLQSSERSRFAAADIDESLKAARSALDAMDALATDVPDAAGTWKLRRAWLERGLVRPLTIAQVDQTQRPQRRTTAAP